MARLMTTMSIVIGFVHRLVYATLFALLAWHACTWPLGDAPRQRAAVKAVCYTFNYPTALVGRVTAPYRGIDAFFDRGGEWCDFCSVHQVLWYQLRFAVPVYVVLFYIPTFVSWLIRNRRSRSRRNGSTPGFESPNHA